MIINKADRTLTENKKIGVADMGGGFRGIYGAGVLDYCLENGIYFDYCIGVSAGSANIASYLARQKGRNYSFYTEYSYRKEYAGIGNLIKKKAFIDLDYVYGTLSNHDGESPLDFQAIKENPAEFVIVATNAVTGRPVYFNKDYLTQDHYDACKGSSALPGASHPYNVGKIPCFDGGISDPVPIAKAFRDGCSKVVLILTKPRDSDYNNLREIEIAKVMKIRYPKIAEQLVRRHDTYMAGVELAKKYEQEGKLLIVAPDDICGMTTLSRSQDAMKQMYQKGYKDGSAIKAFLEKCMNIY